MTRGQLLGFRYRWLWLGLWAVGLVLWLNWLCEPLVGAYGPWWLPTHVVRLALDAVFDIGPTAGGLVGVLGYVFRNRSLGAEYVTAVALIVAFFVAAHWLFLRLGRHSLADYPARRMPTATAAIAAGFMAALLTMSLAATVLETCGYWPHFVLSWLNVAEGLAARFQPVQYSLANFSDELILVPSLALLAVAWALWHVVFSIFWRRRERFWQYERMTFWQTIGGAVLTVTALLAQLATRANRGDHLAMDGYYTGLTLGGTVLLWAWGCRVITVFRLRRFERSPVGAICAGCGYDLTGTLMGKRTECPECGANIPEEVRRTKITQTVP
jgi:hypothetical protein